MRDWTPCPGETLLSIGSPNAAVFPEPVSECPMMSFPVRINGMACDWINVGVEYPWSCIALRIGAGRFRFENGMVCSYLFFKHRKSKGFPSVLKNLGSRYYIFENSNLFTRVFIYKGLHVFFKKTLLTSKTDSR